MTVYRLRWPKVKGAEGYEVWISRRPGGDYELLAEVEQGERPEYLFVVDMIPKAPSAQGMRDVELSWEPPEHLGVPFTFKVTYLAQERRSFEPERDVLWLQDALPVGAFWEDDQGLETMPWSFATRESFRVTAEAGAASPRFAGATIPLVGSVIIWAWVPPGKAPEALWIELHDGEGWVRSAYWGMDLFAPFSKGTERIYMGEIPSPGVWYPLIIPLHRLRLEKAFGLAFGVGHRTREAQVYFDCVLYSTQPVMAAPLPHQGVRYYEILRNGRLIAQTTSTSFHDPDAIDIRGFDVSHPLQPNYHFEDHPSGTQVAISWTVPQEQGTTYEYGIVSVSYNGDRSSPAKVLATVSSSYGKTLIYADTSPITESTPLLAEVDGSSFVHEGLSPGTMYFYRFDVLSPSGELLSRTELSHTTPYGSRLDHFILDYSRLA